MTIREAISRVLNGVDGVKRDGRYSKKYIYSILKSTAELLLKQDSRNKKLFQNLTNLSTFDCVELEDKNIQECSGLIIKTCKTVKQSKITFPVPYFSFTNKPLIFVTGIEDGVELLSTTPYEYIQNRNNEFKGKKQYFWFEKDRLIFPDTELEYVKVRGYFQEDFKTEKLFLDQNFNIPNYLEADVFKLAITEIMTFNKRIQKDENINLNTNQK